MLTLNQKKEMIEFKRKHTRLTHKEVAEYFSTKFKLLIARRTISDILKEATKIMQISDVLGNSKKIKRSKFPLVEKALDLWIEQESGKNNIVSEMTLKFKAEQFAKTMVEVDFKVSNGFIQRFKSRMGICSRKMNGEMAVVDIENHLERIEQLKQTISNFDARNVYNMDDTGLEYRAMPEKTLTKICVKGFKKLKERVTLVLCCSLNGKDKRKITVIGKSAMPRVFSGFKKELYVEYRATGKAWMSGDIFKEWVEAFNCDMKRQKRKILLLMDNCTVHKKMELSNIQIEFLPPNTTGILQPLDLGIIRSFKCNYRRRVAEDVFLMNERGIDTFSAYKTLSLRDVILHVHNSWNDVSIKTFKNSWGISTLIDIKSETIINNEENLMECAAIVGFLRVENRMDINEYVDIDKDIDCFGDYADEEIIRVVKEVYEEISSDENVVEEEKNIKEESVCDLWKRFTEMANDICTILLQDGSTDPTMVKNANELKRFGLQKIMANKKQGTLDRYFK